MLDIIFAIVIVIALFKGYKKGLIIALFSLIAFIVGIAAAVKLSAAVASYFQPHHSSSSKWLVVLSFVVLFLAVVLIIFSVCLFYADKIHLFEKATLSESLAYPYVQPIGPKVIEGLGKWIPLFKNAFSELEDFFSSVSDKIYV
jgi:membrane protein required for colicin V production